MIGALLIGVFALGVLAAPALAVKEKLVFGKFVATTTNEVKGKGTSGEMTLGPYKFSECEKELKSDGSATAGESETFVQEVKFNKCETTRSAGSLEEPILASFTLPMEFHSNGALKIGPTTFKAGNSACEVVMPAQWIPPAAETKGEYKTFESAVFETEEESLIGQTGLEKKYGPIRKRLHISWALKGVKSTVALTSTCQYKGTHLNSAGEAEYGGGKMEGELEGVTLKDGNISFEPAV